MNVSNWMIFAAMIIVGMIFLLAVKNVVLNWLFVTDEDTHRADAQEINSLIYRASTESTERFYYCIGTKPTNISISQGNFIFQRTRYSFSYIVPKNVSETELQDATRVCIIKEKDVIHINETVSFQFCPDKNYCPGAPVPPAYEDSLGRSCCPESYPVCSNKHCCPEDKPRWCEKTKDGSDPRCMSEDDYGNTCKKGFPILYIPLNYGAGEFATFQARAQQHFNKFVTSHAPSKECSDPYSVFEAYYLDPSKCTTRCTYTCGCSETANSCARSNFGDVILQSGDYLAVGICKGESCIICDPSYPGPCCGCVANICFRGSASLSVCSDSTISHEIGHSFCLYHVDTICDNPPGPCLGLNAGDCSASDKSQDLLTYCAGRSKYGPIAYNYLKNDVFQQYLQGC